MFILKLAYRNLMGAGLRTWLNVIVLSFSFVVIIWYQGLLEGWNQQARSDTINWQIGGGEYWQKNYDPYDPFTLSDSHSPISPEMEKYILRGELTPILMCQATFYPNERIQSVLLKGIDPGQEVLDLPTEKLSQSMDEIPVLIGTRMASSSKLQIGDLVTIRWRDVNGTFDAENAKIVGIFKTNVPAVDQRQLWVPLHRLQKMLQMPGEATILVAARNSQISQNFSGWSFKDQNALLSEIDEIIRRKSVGAAVMYILLLLLAMLGIFDTQILSIFRRQKEIGTDMALGMTRTQVVTLFTSEGAMHAILAAILAAVYGIPLLALQAVHGFKLPQATDDYGLAIAEKIFPVYSVKLVAGTILIVFITATIVSYLPSRKIAKMKPTEAIRGKVA